MDQFMQIQNNLRQVRQELNNTLNHINQRLANSEQMIQSLGSQLSQQDQSNTRKNFSSQYSTAQYGQSQYNPNQFQNTAGNYTNHGVNSQEKINPISGLSENKPTMAQKTGVNKYGASYSSGNNYGQ